MRQLAPYLFGLLFAAFIAFNAAHYINAALEHDSRVMRVIIAGPH